MGRRHRLLAAGFALALGLTTPTASLPVSAAENLVFISGGFRRSIPVNDLAVLANTGNAQGLLADLLRFSRQKPEEVAKLLNQSLSMPVVLVSRLLNTRIGEAILERVAKIIYPLQASEVGLQALRAAIVLGLAEGNGTINAISFLRAYPTSELAVNLPALMTLMSKAGSITDLVRFFSESPLDGLRGDPAKAAPAPAPGDSTQPAPSDTPPASAPTTTSQP
ncbi:MAG: alpha/beta hydrolase [Synechococcaceae cyanobacterium]|nr:alpha/beta hydrolase [Synechococcaceae cyanobacterium]